MTPRARVEAALRGEMPDKVPFTVYERKIPQCTIERQLRNEGLCIVVRTVPVVRTITPNVTAESHIFHEEGVCYTRTIYHTPVGDLSTLTRPAGFTSWHVEKIFRRPMITAAPLPNQDRQYLPNYAASGTGPGRFWRGWLFPGAVGSTPFEDHDHDDGGETFAIEWVERRDEIMKLYDALVEKLRSLYPLLADSPALAFNYGGNETADVMGRERFEKYVAPHYDEAAEVSTRRQAPGRAPRGNNRVTGQTSSPGPDSTMSSAFTPAPDTDMSMADARRCGRTKSSGSTTSSYLSSIETIEEVTRQILRDAAPGDRLLVGITEDVPGSMAGLPRRSRGCSIPMAGRPSRHHEASPAR